MGLIALHLLLKGGDRGVQGSQLTLEAIAPEHQAPQLALPVPLQEGGRITQPVTTEEGGNHGKM